MDMKELENIILNLWGEEFKCVSEIVKDISEAVESLVFEGGCTVEHSPVYEHDGAVFVELYIVLDDADGYVLYFKKVNGSSHYGLVWMLDEADKMSEN